MTVVNFSATSIFRLLLEQENAHGSKYKKSAKKVGAKLVLHAFAKLKGENRSAGAEQYTLGQIYNIWQLGGGEYIAGEKNDMYQPGGSRVNYILVAPFYRLTWSALCMADKLVAEKPTVGNNHTTSQSRAIGFWYKLNFTEMF